MGMESKTSIGYGVYFDRFGTKRGTDGLEVKESAIEKQVGKKTDNISGTLDMKPLTPGARELTTPPSKRSNDDGIQKLE